MSIKYYKTKSGKMLAALPNGEMIEVSNTACKIKDDPSTSAASNMSSIDLLLQSSHGAKKDISTESIVLNKNYNDLTNFENLPNVDNIEAIQFSSLRLRKLISVIDDPNDFLTHISKEDLRRNLEFFANTIDSILKNAKRRFSEEDDVLSEVEPDAVPSEVRNWLSMTFTRSLSNMKKKIDDKPKFKSVAHAIRAGIMVDRMLRRMSSSLQTNLPANVSATLKTINEWNFDIFIMNDYSEGQCLRYLAFELMQKYNILSKYKIHNLIMQNFLEGIEVGYGKYKNPYHNAIHATDVLQTTFHILNSSGLMNWLTDIEIFATFFSAIIHDFEHTGTTNNFHIQSRSEIALIYNDRAVLENYHISAAYKLMLSESCNVLQEFTRDEYKEFRQLSVEMVLATDMSYHFTQIKAMKNMLSLGETIDKQKALSLILHCADIGHPTKHWPLHEKWTNLLMEEFFAQGDKEKGLGLPFSPLCDRKNTPIAESQIGFINFIVEPSFNVMGDMIDKIFEQILAEDMKRQSNSDIIDLNKTDVKPQPINRPWAECLIGNKSKWQQLADAEKQRKLDFAQNNETKTTNNNDDNNNNDNSTNTH